MLAEAWANDIVTVISSGNRPDLRMGERTPQRFGKAYNALITVGSMTEDGEIWENNSPPGPVRDGHDPYVTGTSGSHSVTVESDATAMRQADESEALRIFTRLHTASVFDHVLTRYRLH